MSEKSTPTRTIPIGRHVDLANLSQSVGGTWYGTTPGGTRIIYDRNTLLTYKSSPMSKTPPTNLPSIPGVTNNEHQQAAATAKRSPNPGHHHATAAAAAAAHQQNQQHNHQHQAAVTAPSSTNSTTSDHRGNKDDAEEGMFEMDD